MRRAALTTAAIAVLTLTGCAATPDEPEATQTVAPLVAETPAPAETGDTAEAVFLAAVREGLPANTQIPNATDEQLLAAGKEACERRTAGEASDTISLIDGEEQNVGGYYVDSGIIITAAMRNLCAD